MKLLAFSVYDQKAECFGHPFFTSTTGIAARYLQQWLHNPQTTISQNPEDFSLYQVGTWDDNQAKFTTDTPPIFVARASDNTQEQNDMWKKIGGEK